MRVGACVLDLGRKSLSLRLTRGQILPLIMRRKAKGSPVHFKPPLASPSAPGIVKIDSVGQGRCPSSHDQYATYHSVSARLGKRLRPNEPRQSDG